MTTATASKSRPSNQPQSHRERDDFLGATRGPELEVCMAY